MNVYKKRIRKIQEEMAIKALECVMLLRPEDTFYISGYCSPSEGKPVIVIIPRQRDAIMIIAEHEEEIVRKESWVNDLRTYVYYSIAEKASMDEQIAKLVLIIFKELNILCGKIGIEEPFFPYSFFKIINKKMRNIEYEGFSPILENMQVVKSHEEIESIKKAVMLCDIGQDAIRGAMKEEVTEIELFAKARASMEIAAGERISLEADLVTGKRTEEGGGAPGTHKLCKGDLVIADLFPQVHGYWGDTTRTFFVGKISKRQKEIYKIVFEALNKGIEAIKPGVRSCDIDKTVRDCIKKAGYKDYFNHHTGHGIGLTHFESPLLVPYNDCELKAGMVLAIEPGIYFPGFGGIRIEEDVLVTNSQAELLSKYRLELETI